MRDFQQHKHENTFFKICKRLRKTSHGVTVLHKLKRTLLITRLREKCHRLKTESCM